MESAKPSDPEFPQKEPPGIALFMVIAAMSILSLLVTEFVYVAQVSRQMAYDGFDQLKAHYVAKSGLKLSLLRIKAYQTLSELAASQGKQAMVPKGILEQIWAMPIMFPIPEIPGMTMQQKDALKKFTDSTRLDGTFTSFIQSESSKFNLNSVLKDYAPLPQPSPSPTPSSSPPPDQQQQFNAQAAFESLASVFQGLLEEKLKTDEDFAAEYRDFRLEEFLDSLRAWVDRSYQSRGYAASDHYQPKRAPFYSKSELRMIPPMDDRLYDLFSPSFTVSHVKGVNINTISKETFKILMGTRATEEEIEEFFKYRDSQTEDHLFGTADQFFEYIKNSFSAFASDAKQVDEFKKELATKNISIITDENRFQIVVTGKVNNAVRVFEVFAELLPKDKKPPGSANSGAPVESPAPSSRMENTAGLKITFMRIL